MEYNEFIDWIKERNSGIVGFAGAARLGNIDLVMSADGVGTKILVAKELNKFSTIGIDLVAMNVNDVLTRGAVPFAFLDYIACGEIKDYIKDIIKGIELGCEIADCKLLGGETSIMPDMYGEDDFDLAGFAIGAVSEEFAVPMQNLMEEGDPIYGIASSGIHSNGLTIARKVLPKDMWEELLIPTKIYLDAFKKMKGDDILGIANITGGGFSNIDRILPSHLKADISFNWEIPDIFKRIMNSGGLFLDEMMNIFNLGVGMAFVINKSGESNYKDTELFKIGELKHK